MGELSAGVDHLESCARHYGAGRNSLVGNWVAMRQFDGRHDWPEDIPQLTCPTLIVTGDLEKGTIVTPAIATRVQALNPRCTIAHIPGTGHHIHFGDYDAYMQHVHTFLSGLA